MLTKKLLEFKIEFVNTKTLKELLEIKNERTFYRIVNGFIENNVIVNIEKNKYYVSGKILNTFELANFIVQPSYISLESALNHWGILSQFPIEVTSITNKKSIIKKFEGKVYSYSHISFKYFGIFTKVNNFLIALPEKALFDQLYLVSKGIKSTSFDEYDLSRINKKTFVDICKQLQPDKNVLNFVRKYIK